MKKINADPASQTIIGWLAIKRDALTIEAANVRYWHKANMPSCTAMSAF